MFPNVSGEFRTTFSSPARPRGRGSRAGKLEPSPRSWAWGGPDRVNFRDVDDWGILPAGILYVREVSKTASGAERRVPNFYARKRRGRRVSRRTITSWTGRGAAAADDRIFDGSRRRRGGRSARDHSTPSAT